MQTILYHQQQGNMQSCFEPPQIFEVTATLKLKVQPPRVEVNNKDVGGGGWSFLQCLSDISKDAAGEKEISPAESAAYVHPSAAKRWSSSSPSRLSEKSLALCTEPLGSETGVDIAESSIFAAAFDSCPPEPSNSRREQAASPLVEFDTNYSVKSAESQKVVITASYKSANTPAKNSRNKNFPPPLTTISGGANSLRVKPHREGGRLIIRAVETPSRHCYLHAERSHGRLRLCFFSDAQTVSNNNALCRNEENEGSSQEFIDENDEFESDIDGEDETEVEEVDDEEQEQEDDYDEEESNDVYTGGDMDGNTFEVEVEMGMNKCLVGRCKESQHSNKGLGHWVKPLWVAT